MHPAVDEPDPPCRNRKANLRGVGGWMGIRVRKISFGLTSRAFCLKGLRIQAPCLLVSVVSPLRTSSLLTLQEPPGPVTGDHCVHTHCVYARPREPVTDSSDSVLITGTLIIVE